jgi:hypothetical protein
MKALGRTCWQPRIHLAALAMAASVAVACSGAASGTRAPASPVPGAGGPGDRPARFSERDLLLDPPTVHGDEVVRFPDELWPISDAVATLMSRPEAGGYRVLPAAPLRALWRDTQAGRLPGLTALCDAAPPPARLAHHLHSGASTADPRVDCPAPEKESAARPPCRLEVLVSAPRPTAEDPDNTERGARFVAALPPGEPAARWAERLLATGLAREPERDSDKLGYLMGTSASDRRPLIVVNGVVQSGGWQTAISSATFKGRSQAIIECAATASARQPFRDWWVQPYLIEVDAAGSVRRCEFEHVDHLPPPEFGCVCGVLRQISFGAGPDGRRARFDLTVLEAPPPGAPRDRLRRSVSLGEMRSSDRSAILGTGAIDRSALEACLWPVTSPLADTETPVRFTVGADGRATRHEARWPAPVPPPVRACLEPVLARARFNCPLSGAAVIDAQLSLAVRAP